MISTAVTAVISRFGSFGFASLPFLGFTPFLFVIHLFADNPLPPIGNGIIWKDFIGEVRAFLSPHTFGKPRN